MLVHSLVRSCRKAVEKKSGGERRRPVQSARFFLSGEPMQNWSAWSACSTPPAAAATIATAAATAAAVAAAAAVVVVVVVVVVLVRASGASLLPRASARAHEFFFSFSPFTRARVESRHRHHRRQTSGGGDGDNGSSSRTSERRQRGESGARVRFLLPPFIARRRLERAKRGASAPHRDLTHTRRRPRRARTCLCARRSLAAYYRLTGRRRCRDCCRRELFLVGVPQTSVFLPRLARSKGERAKSVRRLVANRCRFCR